MYLFTTMSLFYVKNGILYIYIYIYIYIYGLLSDSHFNWINYKFITRQFWCNISSTEISNHRKINKGSRGSNEQSVRHVTRGCGFESRLRQELSMTEVRPLSKAPNPQLLSGRRNVGCLLLQVCVHLDGLNVENTFHCWLYSVYVTNKAHLSLIIIHNFCVRRDKHW